MEGEGRYMKRTEHFAEEHLKSLINRLLIEDLVDWVVTILDALHVLIQLETRKEIRRCKTCLPLAP